MYILCWRYSTVNDGKLVKLLTIIYSPPSDARAPEVSRVCFALRFMCMYIYIYIYMYRESQRDRERERQREININNNNNHNNNNDNNIIIDHCLEATRDGGTASHALKRALVKRGEEKSCLPNPNPHVEGSLTKRCIAPRESKEN